MALSGEKRLVVVGHPGAGKTTFVKHIVYKWANAVESNQKNTMLHQFVFVIPIILRLVKPGSTLTDILIQQLPLSKLDICVLQHALKQSSLLMLILDGYDEITCQGVIQKIIRKEKLPNATVVITTRPHGLSLIHQLGYGIVQLLVEIIGFNSKQIQFYIDKFMLANGQESQDTLFKQISTNNRLLKLGESPTRLEIICFVWLIHGNLGDGLSDLYQLLLIALLRHKERKTSTTMEVQEEMSDQELLQKYHPFLLKLSKMANKWDENGYIQAIFQHDQLLQYLGTDIENAKHLGCIVKYNPSKSEERSDWSFTHLTLQYYFVAYFLSHSTVQDALLFSESCSPNEHMDTIRGIMQFLCLMEAKIANTILKSYTKMISGKNECLKLQKFLCELVNEYKSLADINIPLPKYVLWTKEQDIKSLMILTQSDKANNHKSMKYLEIKRIDNEMKKCDLSYVENISMTLRHPHELGIMSELLKKASRLKNMNLVLRNKTSNDEVEKLLENVPKHVNKISVNGHNSIKAVGKVISTFPHVSSLYLTDRSQSTGQLGSPWTNIIDGFSNVDSIVVEQNLFDESLFFSNFPGYLMLHFFERGDNFDILREKLLADFTCRMRFLLFLGYRNNIKYLNLSGLNKKHNNLTAQGDVIGLLLVRTSAIEVLKLNFCNLNSHFLSSMALEIARQNRHLVLKKLSMSGNNLKGAGDKLANVLRFTPKLTELELCDSQLDDEDFDQLDPERSQIPKLKLLNVSGNALESSSSKGFHNILHNKPELTVLSMGWCNIDAKITESIFPDTHLQRLEELDLHYNHLGNSGLSSLAYHMSKMPSLKILNLSRCGCSDADELVMLCGFIPPLLEELDVRSNLFDKDIVKVREITYASLYSLVIIYPCILQDIFLYKYYTDTWFLERSSLLKFGIEFQIIMGEKGMLKT